jgi:hypothetical protein
MSPLRLTRHPNWEDDVMKPAKTTLALTAMFLVAVAIHLGSFSMNAQAPQAPQQAVTPFTGLSIQLQMQPGQTYLAFMMSKVKPALDTFDSVIRQDPAYAAKHYQQLQQDLIQKHAGVAIRIDSNNYFFNVGYNNGTGGADDVKSGRSYGVGPTQRQSDPSDVAYLTELAAYYQSEPGSMQDFFHALLIALFNCDPSGWSADSGTYHALSKAGQIVATDFMAIYTAESDRHIMVHLAPKSHPWEVDLAAATFVSEFVSATGKLMVGGQLKPGAIGQWWAKGTSGSGIGETRRDRIKLQQKIADYEFKVHPDLVTTVNGIVGTTTGHDPIQEIFEYLNTPNGPKNLNNPDGDKLMSALLTYMENVKKDAATIAQQP